VNPNPDKKEHVLNIDESDNRPDLAAVLLTVEWYGLQKSKAEQMIEEVVAVAQKWPEVARRAGISGGEIELMSHVFSGYAAN
jgi:serine/threonine-protein kinase HipA